MTDLVCVMGIFLEDEIKSEVNQPVEERAIRQSNQPMSSIAIVHLVHNSHQPGEWCGHDPK